MSNDPSPSSAARQQDSDPEPGAEEAIRSNGTVQLYATRPRRSRSDANRRRRKKKKGSKKPNPGLVKKLAFLNHLLKDLDLLVFAELSSLYYMEYVGRRGHPLFNVPMRCRADESSQRCSMFRFILRAASHSLYLTPPDESFPIPMSSQMPIVFVLIPNFLCVLLHIFGTLPHGPDYNRGYQHGGVITDFVGQKPSTSRIYYLLVDIAILLVQCLMFSLHIEKRKLSGTLNGSSPTTAEEASPAAAAPTVEDLDAEERGVPREDLGATANQGESVELRDLGRSDEASATNESREEDESQQRERSSDGDSRTHLSDILDSGNGVLGEYHLIHSIRTAAVDLESTAAYSLQSISYSATLAAIEARRRGRRATQTQGRQSGRERSTV